MHVAGSPLWAGTASARRRRAMAPFPVDPGRGDGRGCARLGAGGTPALPGSHQSHDIVTPRARNCRSILVPLTVEGGPSVFLSIRVYSSSFVPLRGFLFLAFVDNPSIGFRMLNASIKSLATIHWPLSTIHLTTPPPHTTIRIIQGETGVFQASPPPPWLADHSRVKQRSLYLSGAGAMSR